MACFLFLAKRLLISSSFPFHHHHQHQLVLLTPLLLRHSLSTQPHQPNELPFIAQYLISSFAFSPHRALKYAANAHLTAIKSSERPESVVTFLKDIGLSDDQIQAVVSFDPRVLGFNVEKTLKPKVRELMDGGFSGEVLVQLIRYNPDALVRKNTLSCLSFWRNFVGNNDEVLLKIIQKNGLLITFDIDRHIVPCINLLRKEYGLSSQDVVSLMTRSKSRWFGHNPDSLRQALKLIEELGISRGSRMFVNALKAIGGYNIDKIKRKMEFFMVTYAWSEEEVSAAFRKFPGAFALSENKVKSNMDFLIKKAEFESRSIALNPRLLSCSVERVLFPRYTVISALEAKGKKKCSFFTACIMTESNFLERYVVPYEMDVPGLDKAYAAAFGGKVIV